MDLLSEDDDKELIERRHEVLKQELRYLSSNCETIITGFYYEKLSLKEIMLEINYKTVDSVKAKKSNCMKRLTERVKVAFKMLNLID